ncbi:hypothetical protein [uncultured Parvimonas sp.]
MDESKSLEIFHPIYTWKRTSYENYTLRPMLKKFLKVENLYTIYQI